ncbi:MULTISPECIES: flagellar hook protein FlgE [Pseudomonas]|uniref:Flagellar hook protein FlgE n=4 Tax=Pseudomonas TaxID=286 RepID=A0AAX0VZY7_9PSED|nr:MULTISPECIES: flagellar hook protein FlgE [Pseudomonas]MBH3359470.1 flagellar hook protein FlgE [Pseudomonas guariconensis]MCO7621413.1 flagellar hook protein FlgE [Pseudomonas guariconensis]MDM9593106.1 flagellar hook protein FlgE [Pseudomonas guariconensis]MDM9605933.1 flagellar hook protein FlgE [Pseudomonas guariconensis]MDM9610890.1 flagellar hook protein FlgE [Pseudomonas guariconensis]
MSFNIGLSGLYAANKQLDVTGNNIANVNTVGFKSSRAEFADVYAGANRLGVGKNQVGNGVRLAAVSQQFSQGDINNTGNVLDMGIQGQGFFVLSDNGSMVYTRAGAFQTNKDNYVVTSDGLRLQGYAADSTGKIQKGVLTDLKIDTSALAPKATSLIDQGINLNSSATDIPLMVDDGTGTMVPNKPFDPSDETTYTKSFPTKVYDSQGNEHTMEQFYRKTGTNQWTMYTLVDGRNPFDPASTTPLSGTISFNSDGSVNAMTANNTGLPPGSSFTVNNNTFTMTGWIPASKDASGNWAANGAAGNAGGMRLSMNSTTSYNTETARMSQSQDGYATGILSSLSIDSTGVMFASFSNQQSRAIGQVAVASFANEQGLQQIGGTRWTETFSSGIPGIDAPKTGTLGSVESNSLEASNVNLTQELVELIKAQSNYQANAKTISTESTIMQTIIQMT